MEEVVFCEGCHRVLSPDYRFCPYCGREQLPLAAGSDDSEADPNAGIASVELSATVDVPEGTSFEEIVDESLERVQESVREYTIRRLEEFTQKLLHIETELDTILTPSVVPNDEPTVVEAAAPTADMNVSTANSTQSADDRR
ncbi:MAG TPA: hypothetical protein VMW73_17745 [Spirochaetia bacterium]|nr:hypothetical protein [Spirochaetia bacterium]